MSMKMAQIKFFENFSNEELLFHVVIFVSFSVSIFTFSILKLLPLFTDECAIELATVLAVVTLTAECFSFCFVNDGDGRWFLGV